MEIYQPHTIISVTLTEEGKIEVVKKYPSNEVYLTNPPRPAPDKIVKEIYVSNYNRIILFEKIYGKHIPSYIVEEIIQFPKE